MRDNWSMSFLDRVVITNAKTVSTTSTGLGIGAGETWPGELALKLRPQIASYFGKQFKKGVILVVGTNGKTTTTLMIKKILEAAGDRVIHNATGANLLNGIVSSCIRQTDWKGNVNAEYGLFEVDENSLPVVLKYIIPKRIVILNLFRDQLDRYGEVDVIIEKWQKVLKDLPVQTEVIVNSDDPSVAYFGHGLGSRVTYFGLNDTKEYLNVAEHATDSTFCPQCGARLVYEGIYYSHIGVWRCEKCNLKRPTPDVHTFPKVLDGLYNQYNALAAVSLAKSLGIKEEKIKIALKDFSPAFGRQEEIVVPTSSAKGGIRRASKTVKLFLSKNPTGFNASIRTALELGAKHIFLVLNDRIPDGTDVSWIWDVDFEVLKTPLRQGYAGQANITKVYVSGDRVYDLALRLEYAEIKIIIEPDLEKGIRRAIEQVSNDQTLFVLATYSGMLDVRKILTGKKIL